jgi:cell division septation protein DedD
VARPAAAPRARASTSRGRLAARITTSTTAAIAVSISTSSLVKNWAAVSSPSQMPVRTPRPRPVLTRSAASMISGGSTRNCRP